MNVDIFLLKYFVYVGSGAAQLCRKPRYGPSLTVQRLLNETTYMYRIYIIFHTHIVIIDSEYAGKYTIIKKR